MLFLQYPPCSTCQKAKKWLDDHGIQLIFQPQGPVNQATGIEEFAGR